MYKVFINDRPIIISGSPQIGLNYQVHDFDNIAIEEVVYKLKKNILNGIILLSNDLARDWGDFTSHFKLIKAAGGLVINDQNEFLFIYRGSHWDLPKGRIEINETAECAAIREVEEECGIEQLSLDRFLITTYHLFHQDNQDKLKETHWYLMKSNYKGKLTPQFEEGITIAEFKNKAQTSKALENTYANIHLVFHAYKS